MRQDEEKRRLHCVTFKNCVSTTSTDTFPLFEQTQSRNSLSRIGIYDVLKLQSRCPLMCRAIQSSGFKIKAVESILACFVTAIVCRVSLWECERDAVGVTGRGALRILRRTNANVLDLDNVGIVPDCPPCLNVRLLTRVWDENRFNCYANNLSLP